jgi:uncharacterized protein (DUF927 family)
MVNTKNIKNLEDIIKTDFDGKSFEDPFIFDNNTKLPNEYNYIFPSDNGNNDEEGLKRLYLKKTKKGDEIEQIHLTDSLLYIQNNVYSLENNNYNFEVVSAKRTFKNQYSVKSAICSASTLSSKSLLIKFLNNDLNINCNDLNYLHFIDYFAKFLYTNRNSLISKNAVQKLGWYNGKFAQYDNQITFDYSDDTQGRLKEIVNAVSPEGDIKDWTEIMNKFSNSKDFNIIMGTSFASPLLKLLGRRSYQLITVGDSENGKSFAGACALSIWGNPSILMIGSKDTENAIPKKANINQNIFMMIDDPFKKGKLTKGIYDNYMLANEKGRGRLNKDSKLMKEDRWRLTSLTTTETPLLGDHSNAGEYNRVLEYPVAKMYNIAKKEIKKLYSELDKNYSVAGEKYINGILDMNIKEIEKILQKIEDNLYSHYKDEKLESHIDCIALSVLGLYLGNKIVFDKDNFNFCVDCGMFVLEKLMSKFEARQEIKAVEEMYSYYETNQYKFSEDQRVNEKLGCVKAESIIFIIPPLKLHLENLGYNFKNFKKYLLDNNLAEYKQVKINKQASWRLVVPFQSQDEVKQITDLYYISGPEIKHIEIDLNNIDDIKKLNIKVKYFEIRDSIPIPFDIGKIDSNYNKYERKAIIEENELPFGT